MAFGEGPTRPGFQVALETIRGGLVWELENHRELPRAILRRVTSSLVVMPLETPCYVAGRADVVAIGFTAAAKYINKPFRLDRHRDDNSRNRSARKSEWFE